MILSFRTDRSRQTVQTQIRLLLEDQSDQGLHYLQYCLHVLDALPYALVGSEQYIRPYVSICIVSKSLSLVDLEDGQCFLSVDINNLVSVFYLFLFSILSIIGHG